MAVILILYGFICWFAALAYAAITHEVRISYIFLAGPLIISSVVTLLAIGEYVWWATGARRRAARRRADTRRREA